MTSDATHDPRPEDRDALLSAYALGELGGEELAAVERLLADPAADEARRIVAETRTVAAALRAARAHEPPAGSADLRRAVLARLAGTPADTGPAPRGRWASLSGWLAMAGALAATVLVAVTLVTPARDTRAVARRQAHEQRDALARQEAVGMPLAIDESVAEQATAAPAAAAGDDGLAKRSAAAFQGAAQDGQAAKPAAPRSRAAPAPAVPRVPAAAGDVDPSPLAVELSEFGAAVDETAGRADASARLAVKGQVLRDTRAMPRDAETEKLAAAPERRRVEELAKDKDRETRERYAWFEENRFVAVADRPLSTFSIDVDTASYAVVRRFLAAGQLPPADAVRLEEFVNYFRYSYPRPDGDDPFAVALEAADCPWHAGHRLVRVGIAGRDIDRAKRPSGNLVFLVDVSGSMDEPDKLPLVKQALAMLVDELAEDDRVSIVTYAGDAGLKLPPTTGDRKQTIRAVIDSLAAGGSTHGSAGIELAYAQAAETFIRGGANRVILCTDGDLNVGITSDAALVELVQDKARGGTFLTVLGFGRGNLQDEKMEKLADKGNGVYAYVDGVREARKVLVEQLTGSTITIAKDVKIQVEFNPSQVASYRLLGYENRRLADADFRDDTKDAGEIGAGHTVTALYEIVPAGAATAPGDGPGPGAEPLKYQAEKPRVAEPGPAGPASRELLTVKLRFKQPEGDASVLREFPLADHGGAFAAATADTRFAAAVAAFGMLLRASEFKGEATLPMVAEIAGAALGADEGGYRAEFLDLVRKAESLQANERR